MMEAIGELASGAMSGAGLGLIGSLGTGIIGMFTAGGKRKHELALGEQEIRTINAEGEQSFKTTKLTTETELQIADTDAHATRFAATHKYDKRTYSNGILKDWNPGTWIGKGFKSICFWQLVQVDFLRGVTRPVLTAGLVIYAAWFYSETMAQATLTDELASAIVLHYAKTFTTLVSMAVTWWYGERGIGKQMELHAGAGGGGAPVDSGSTVTASPQPTSKVPVSPDTDVALDAFGEPMPGETMEEIDHNSA